MKEIQKKYKGDRQKMNEELMKFYRENNINPAASCLPLLAQFPIFIALFYVLRNFAKEAEVPVNQLGDLSWLHVVPSVADNVTAHWSGYVLLFVYAASQISSTYFMSATMDRTQRWIMMALPIVFLPLIANFPTGLVLYWMTTNLWTVGQGLVTRRLAPKMTPPPKRSSRTPPKERPDDDGDGVKAARPAAPKPAGQPRVVRRKKKRARR
jgi:YidC/Oxa1 family membrane protein insertase